MGGWKGEGEKVKGARGRGRVLGEDVTGKDMKGTIRFEGKI